MMEPLARGRTARSALLTVALVLVVVTAGCVGVLESTAPSQETATGTDPASGAHDANGTLEVHYINVGQAAATLVVTPSNETMLVDSGGYRDDGEHVIQYLERRNVSRLDYLVTSHADADHVGGHAAVIEHFETRADGVGAIYDPGIAASTATYETYLDAVERYNVTLYEARRGDSIPLEDSSAQILSPPERHLADGDRNENSLVFDVRFGNTSVLFTGDAGSAGEGELADTYGAALNATVLNAGHHGSKTSTGAPLLDAAGPQVVVVSSAYDSQYGHPHQEVLDRLAARSIPTYWTATHGDVVVHTDGETVSVATQKSAPTDPARLRASEPIDPANDSTVGNFSTPAPGAGGPTTTAPTTTAPSATETPSATATPTATETPSAPTTPTATATPTATDGGTANQAGGQLVLAEVRADAPGNDHENLDEESLVFENGGSEPLDLSGWQVSDEADHTYTFPDGVELAPGETVTLYTASGTDTGNELHWGSERAVWNNDGDTVIVTTADGERILEEAY